MKITMIAAVCTNNGIGLNNSLPWPYNKKDMLWFKSKTLGKPVVMGSNTWKSLPTKPLPGRENIVITSQLIPGVKCVGGRPCDVVATLKENYDEVTIIGGAQIYREFFKFVDRLVLTKINGVYECDTFVNFYEMMAKDDSIYELVESIPDDELTFEVWEKIDERIY